MYAMEHRPGRPPLTEAGIAPLPGEMPMQSRDSDDATERDSRDTSSTMHRPDGDVVPAFIVNVSPVGEAWRD